MLLCACAASPQAPLPVGEPALVEAPAPPATPAARQPDDVADVPAWQRTGARPISAWAVYWDTKDVLTELAPIADRLGTLCFFEAFFAADGTLLLPDAAVTVYEDVERAYPGHAWQSYLTFVNDVKKEDGSFDLKTASPLKPILADTAAMDAHIEELIAFTRERGFDGIELDYEALRKAPELWEPFTVFCARLYARTQREGLGLRVVLEPIAPFETLSFPQGPTYVIMCYNLYGGHSQAGPKADYDFLTELMSCGATLPSKPLFALATGGYDWDEHGDGTQVTLEKACALYKDRGQGNAIRDGRSGAVAFRYKADNGKLHTVWYADARTLALWTQTLQKAGYDEVCYWRLGGNYAE